jgi:small-conductance mechanosensitive channel
LTALGATFLIPTVLVSFIINDQISAALQGALLLKLRPFKIGDRVSLGKHAGEVVDVTIQHVVIKLDDERFMLIPHAVVKESAIRTPREYGSRSKE